MRFIIYGAGAIGSLFGAYLARAGNDTVLIGRQSHVEKINRDGLKIVTAGGPFTVPVAAVTDPSKIKSQPGDIIFITLKAQDTAVSLDSLSQSFPPDTPVFCFQNGVSTESIVIRKFSRVYGGVVYFSGTYLSPGEVAHTRVDKVGFGVYPQGTDGLTQSIFEVLTQAGFSAFKHASVMSVKWSKLVINLRMPVNAITGLSGAETLREKAALDLIADITEEGWRVIQAAGIEVNSAPGTPAVASYLTGLRPAAEAAPVPEIPEELKHRPSIWQDIILKRGQTEIDFLNGEIINLGRQLNLPTPYNSFIVDVLKDMVLKGDSPGKYTALELRQLFENSRNKKP
jgi:2-dehydropantoate 2-reductase